MFNFYPYTDFHELNLDILLRMVKEMSETIKTFVSTNAIKYADPFQWNITSQYEKNTVVIEPVSGVAYLSVSPVPQGIAISNTDYWTPVFDLSQLITGLNDNFTENNEQLNIVSSTNYSVDDWIIWKNYLYKVIATITAGDLLNEGVNIERLTVEDAVKALSAAINNVTSYVNAKFDAIRVLNIAELGCIGDGVTDNAAAFASIVSRAASEKLPIYIPAGNFVMSSYITVNDDVEIFGAGDNSIITFDGTNGLLMKNNTSLKDVKVVLSSGLFEAININGDGVQVLNCTVRHSHIGIGVYAVKDTLIDGCNIEPYSAGVGNFGVWTNVSPYAENMIITNCCINNHVLNGIFANIKGGTISNNTLRNNHTQTSPNGGGQIDVGGSDDETSIIIDSNVIVEGGGNLTGGIEIAGQQMIVSNNIIRKHTGNGYGIAVNYGSHHTITGNMILQNAVGIATGTSIDGLTIEGNIFRNNIKDLDIYSDNKNVIINNNELHNLGLTSSVMPAIMGVNGVAGSNRNYYNTVANDAQIDLFDPPALGHSYLMQVCAAGHYLIYEIQPTGAVAFVDPVSWCGTVLGTANKINVAISGTRFILENKLGVDVNISIKMIEHQYL